MCFFAGGLVLFEDDVDGGAGGELGDGGNGAGGLLGGGGEMVWSGLGVLATARLAVAWAVHFGVGGNV